MKISKPFGVGIITHVEPSEDLLLSELFTKASFDNFDFLLNMGAIYVGDKRATRNQVVPGSTLVRVHRNPKRHPVEGINWESLIIENNKDFIVVNKPYNVPTHPTVDNSVENVLYQMSKALNKELFITHRLDTETTGLLLIAKNKQFQNIFNYLISNKMVTKKYRALTTRRPEEKRYIHYINPSKFLPKLVSAEPIENWQICELIVEKVNEITLPNGQNGYESIVELITGRTHQIRAQFTGINCPLFGDELYGDENTDFPLGLQSFYLSFKWSSINKEFSFQL